MESVSSLTTRPSFFAPVPERPRDDVLRDYLGFLERRNGSTETQGAYPTREAWMKESEGWQARHRGDLDGATFQASYGRFDPKADHSKAMLAVLAFAKMNAGEAYGVEVVGRTRHKRPVSSLFDQVERVLGNEETYHTRILVGAARQFGLPPPGNAWRPPLPLKLLIYPLAYAPKVLFHPLLLAAEVSGVYTFNWMLQKVGEVFRDEPALRETLEARLIEILVDELGHIAFNRMAVGPRGMAAAKAITAGVAESASRVTPEFVALGWTAETTRAIEKFDLSSVPEEARRRAFFV